MLNLSYFFLSLTDFWKIDWLRDVTFFFCRILHRIQMSLDIVNRFLLFDWLIFIFGNFVFLQSRTHFVGGLKFDYLKRQLSLTSLQGIIILSAGIIRKFFRVIFLLTVWLLGADWFLFNLLLGCFFWFGLHHIFHKLFEQLKVGCFLSLK